MSKLSTSQDIGNFLAASTKVEARQALETLADRGIPFLEDDGTLSVGGIAVRSLTTQQAATDIPLANEIVSVDGRLVTGDGFLTASVLLQELDDINETSLDHIMSKSGQRLIEELQSVRGTNAGALYFSTTLVSSSTAIVRTSTGYARLVNPDNTLGTQAGTGVAGSNITITIPAGSSHRAFGIISVANGGSVRSGNITSFDDGVGVGSLRSITAVSVSGLSALTSLNLNANRLTSFNGNGLSALTELSLNGNRLTSFNGNGLSALTSLNLGSNILTSFSGNGLSALTTLTLNNNRLTSFNGNGLSVLTSLNLNDNRLTSFNGNGLSALTQLSLSVNRLTSFSGNGLSALTILYLGSNILTSFNGNGLSALTRLFLQYNLLTAFDATGLSNIEVISLDNNAQLSGFNTSSISTLNKLFDEDVGEGFYDPSIRANNCNLSTASINSFFTALPITTRSPVTLSFSNNPGSATATASIATAKGYSVIL